MDMTGLADRCMDMMGNSMMGNSIVLVLLLVLFLVWVVGLSAVGALIFWGVRRLSGPHA
jgi:hypothetical protein